MAAPSHTPPSAKSLDPKVAGMTRPCTGPRRPVGNGRVLGAGAWATRSITGSMELRWVTINAEAPHRPV